MKKLFFVMSVFIIVFTSCNEKKEESVTTKDSLTTTMDNTHANAMNTPDTTGMAAKMADPETSEFVNKAMTGSMMEVQLGNIAMQQAGSQAVKDYGSMLAKDHTAAGNELKSIAATNNISVPGEVTAEQEEHINMLKKKSGAEFDKAYISMMLDDHKKDIDAFKTASQKSNNEAVKQFTIRTLPVLQKHLDAAQAISKKM